VGDDQKEEILVLKKVRRGRLGDIVVKVGDK
jgi:hypothetical protein